MKLILKGHEDLYAVEQLQLALFPPEHQPEDLAVSALHRRCMSSFSGGEPF